MDPQEHPITLATFLCIMPMRPVLTGVVLATKGEQTMIVCDNRGSSVNGYRDQISLLKDAILYGSMLKCGMTRDCPMETFSACLCLSERRMVLRTTRKRDAHTHNMACRAVHKLFLRDDGLARVVVLCVGVSFCGSCVQGQCMMTEALACHGYNIASGEILRPIRDPPRRKHLTRLSLPIKNESVGIEEDQIPL
jgi:hypothetical protein